MWIVAPEKVVMMATVVDAEEEEEEEGDKRRGMEVGSVAVETPEGGFRERHHAPLLCRQQQRRLPNPIPGKGAAGEGAIAPGGHSPLPCTNPAPVPSAPRTTTTTPRTRVCTRRRPHTQQYLRDPGPPMAQGQHEGGVAPGVGGPCGRPQAQQHLHTLDVAQAGGGGEGGEPPPVPRLQRGAQW
jgi:hypothetical protein